MMASTGAECTVQAVEAIDPCDGTSMGYQEAWIDSSFSAHQHGIDNFKGEWQVSFAEPNNGEPMTLDAARRYLSELAHVLEAATRIATPEMEIAR